MVVSCGKWNEKWLWVLGDYFLPLKTILISITNNYCLPLGTKSTLGSAQGWQRPSLLTVK